GHDQLISIMSVHEMTSKCINIDFRFNVPCTLFRQKGAQILCFRGNFYCSVNPTLDIVKDSLIAIGDEMFVALQRTAMSPIIYEVLDYASGLTDSKGQLLTQGNGVTGFIGMLAPMVQETLKKFGDSNNLKPGDIILINDPYEGGGSHLSDVGLVMPIFYEDELVAFSANKAHWTEVGGKDAGSMSTDSTDIYQEGLQFPCVKLFEGGKLN